MFQREVERSPKVSHSIAFTRFVNIARNKQDDAWNRDPSEGYVTAVHRLKYRLSPWSALSVWQLNFDEQLLVADFRWSRRSLLLIDDLPDNSSTCLKGSFVYLRRIPVTGRNRAAPSHARSWPKL